MNKKNNKPACVFPIKRDGKIYRYMVRTYINRERHYVGCYKTQEEAVKAYGRFLEVQARKAEHLRRL
ncbi:MAG: hypothetical protein ACK528_03780 [Alphaproteobacteria bacterium]|jgi:hypothetical protein